MYVLMFDLRTLYAPKFTKNNQKKGFICIKQGEVDGFFLKTSPSSFFSLSFWIKICTKD